MERPPPRVSRGWGLLRVLLPGARSSGRVATPLTDAGRPGRYKLGDSTLGSQAFRTHLELWDSGGGDQSKDFCLRTDRPHLDSCSHMTDEKIEAGLAAVCVHGSAVPGPPGWQCQQLVPAWRAVRTIEMWARPFRPLGRCWHHHPRLKYSFT